MSNEIFPTLPGLSIQFRKRPRFSTGIQRAVSGKELRASFASSPIWDFELSFEVLREGGSYGELEALEGFFLCRHGAFDSFLLSVPSDSAVINERIGTGDGETRAFQLARTRSGFTESVANVASIAAGPTMWSADENTPMWKGDSLPMWTGGVDYGPGDYTLSPTGLLTFHLAPPAGLPIYWTGTYYYRARFAEDEQEFERFLDKLWTAKKVALKACLGRKI